MVQHLPCCLSENKPILQLKADWLLPQKQDIITNISIMSKREKVINIHKQVLS